MKYGINILGLVPLRIAPEDQSEMISQVLFGQHFKVLEFKKNWVKIILYSDHYEGWICSKQYMEIEKQYYDQLSLSNPEFSIGKTSYLLDLVDSSEIAIPMGSTLPFFFNGLINIKGKKYKYLGETSSKNIKDVIKYSIQFLNSPYLWGGKSFLGIDCSGFTQLVFSLCGIKIPRDAYQQVKSGKKLNFSETRPGDLIFFINDSDRIHHVGIALKDDKIIHASGKVRIDGLNKDGILNNGIISHKYHSTVRISEK
ncbi:MAG: C40 family peptidase [Flavobacteriales bacterium]|nr:C40 family peptidase [Flavobacteriales bacterium]